MWNQSATRRPGLWSSLGDIPDMSLKSEVYKRAFDDTGCVAVKECKTCHQQSLPFIGFHKPCTSDDGEHWQTFSVLGRDVYIAAKLYVAMQELEPADRAKLIHWLYDTNTPTAKRLRSLLVGLI